MADEPKAWPGRYPPADMTPEEFEEWTAQILESGGRGLDKFGIGVHDRIRGVDGRFDFDATVRFEWAGIAFLILVEAKRHDGQSRGNSFRSFTRKCRALVRRKA
jgi:hypothetical protein